MKLVVGTRAFGARLRLRPSLVAVAALAFGTLVPSPAAGGGRQAPPARTPQRSAPRPFNLPGAPDPPSPVAPEVIVRGDNGRVVVRATKLAAPLTIDGVLDEPVYTEVKSISDFIQTVPNEGEPATERTEAWITYDANNFYLSCRCRDSAAADEWTANELRCDTSQLRQNDMLGALLDTFHDRRNGFNFYTNPLGARADQVVTNEGNPNAGWNPVWFVRTGRFEGGWTVEMAIPFKSIRYVSGNDQEWGIQIRRSIRRKNEWTHLTFVPAATGGVTSIFRASAAATLVGLDLPPASRNVELKPYAISKLATDRVRTPQLLNDLRATGGLDAKYGITANMTADLTINTDFAQVEVDEQQVNLTRFPVVFPEKRDFFLEGRGTFEFARASGQAGFSGQTSINNNAPQLFFTRRIGLNNGREVPIIAGGRVTGTVGKTAIGVMNMETGYESRTDVDVDACAPPYATCTPRTNFTVLRVRRDILRRSSSGAAFGRSFGSARFSPRMRRSKVVRRYLLEGAAEYVVNRAGDVESSSRTVHFLTELQNSDQFVFDVNVDYERLLRPFTVSPGVAIAPGDYPFTSIRTSYAFGQQRRASGTVALTMGNFDDGDLTQLTLSGARMALTKQFSVEPSLTVSRGRLRAGDFTDTLLRTRVDYAFTPLRFFSALVQYNSSDHTFSSNVRFRWEYRPGSEIFVVYTDERDTTSRGYPGLRNRAFVVKVNRLFRF